MHTYLLPFDSQMLLIADGLYMYILSLRMYCQRLIDGANRHNVSTCVFSSLVEVEGQRTKCWRKEGRY